MTDAGGDARTRSGNRWNGDGAPIPDDRVAHIDPAGEVAAGVELEDGAEVEGGTGMEVRHVRVGIEVHDAGAELAIDPERSKTFAGADSGDELSGGKERAASSDGKAVDLGLCIEETPRVDSDAASAADRVLS